MTETKNNAKLIKRIVKKKKIGKTNLLEFFSVSADNLSKVDEKKKSRISLRLCILLLNGLVLRMGKSQHCVT